MFKIRLGRDPAFRILPGVLTGVEQAMVLPACDDPRIGALDAFGSSLGAAHDSIPTRLAEGQRFDIYFLVESGHRRCADEGCLDPTFIPLVESHIGAAVRESEPAPDISTPDALREALLKAGSVAHAASASGIYPSTHVFPAPGIAEQTASTARPIFSERV